MKKGRNIVATSITIIILILNAIFIFGGKQTMIIYLGIGMMNVLKMSAHVALLVVIVIDVGILILNRRDKKKLMITALPREEQMYIIDGANLKDEPNHIKITKFHELLSKYKDESDFENLSFLAAKALEQLDDISKRQEKADSIIRRNNMDMPDVKNALTHAENIVLKNIFRIINRFEMITEYNKQNEHHLKRINDYLGINSNVIDECDKLLHEMMNVIESRDSKATSEFATIQIEATTTALAQYAQMQ